MSDQDGAVRAAEREQLEKVRAMLVRLAASVTEAGDGVQLLRRDRSGGDIEYQIFAGTEPHGRQIAWVQSTRHDAQFIQACLAQAPLFAALLEQAADRLADAGQHGAGD